VGLRLGEVLGIHYEDVDWDNQKLHIQHAVQTLVGQGVYLTEPKTDHAKRTITIPPSAFLVLTRHVEKEAITTGPLFKTKNGTLYNPRNIQRYFEESIQEAGLPHIRFHDMRHTTATLLLTQGAHPKMVQELLGHSSISVTMDTYSHVLPAMHGILADQMEGMLGEGTSAGTAM
jgi:integrase